MKYEFVLNDFDAMIWMGQLTCRCVIRSGLVISCIVGLSYPYSRYYDSPMRFRAGFENFVAPSKHRGVGSGIGCGVVGLDCAMSVGSGRRCRFAGSEG